MSNISLRTVDPTEPAIRVLIEALDEYRQSLYPLDFTLLVPYLSLISEQSRELIKWKLEAHK